MRLFHVRKTKNAPISVAVNENVILFQTGLLVGQMWRSRPIFAHWLKAVDDGELFWVTFVKVVFEGYESRCWSFISGPITRYLFFFFFWWKIMTLPSSMMSSFRVDLILQCLSSIVWNRTAIQVPAQRRTALCWNTSMSQSCEVPPESCWSWNK